jgi:hypothetical protein
MKAGEKRKVFGLSVVASAAVAFALFRLLPSSDAPQTNRSAQQDASGSEPLRGSGYELPTALTMDPFSHPGLSEASSKPEPDKDNPDAPLPFDSGGTVPGGMVTTPFGQMGPSGLSPWVPAPEQTTPGNQQSEVETPGPKVAVHAVFDVGGISAYVSINGGEPRKVREGDKLADGLRIGTIKGSTVELIAGKKRHKVAVGSELQL